MMRQTDAKFMILAKHENGICNEFNVSIKSLLTFCSRTQVALASVPPSKKIGTPITPSQNQFWVHFRYSENQK